MDPAYLPALIGLAGAALGGFASLATSWIMHRSMSRERILGELRRQHERTFLEFIDEASRLYADALGHEKDDVCDLVRLYALSAHIRMISSEQIFEAATATIEAITQLYLAPNRTMREMAGFAAGGGFEPLRLFGELCRAELMILQGPVSLGRGSPLPFIPRYEPPHRK